VKAKKNGEQHQVRPAGRTPENPERVGNLKQMNREQDQDEHNPAVQRFESHEGVRVPSSFVRARAM